MKIYSGRLSLFARKVEIALLEKGLAYDRVMVPFSQETGYAPKHPDVLAANPKGQVPVLVDGGTTLYDSTVILEYLEDAYPSPPLYPAMARDRAVCRLLDLFADEVMLVPLKALMHRTGPRPGDPTVWAAAEDKAKAAEQKLRDHLADLDERLDGRQYFCGHLSVADIAIFMALLFNHRLGGPSIAPYARLAKWFQDLLGRPAFATIAAEIAEADRELSVQSD